jgi:hypothetical protein
MFLPLLSLHDRELCGNSLGMFWGTLWEHFRNFYGNASVNSGNASGTLWELHGNMGLCIPYFTFIEF